MNDRIVLVSRTKTNSLYTWEPVFFGSAEDAYLYIEGKDLRLAIGDLVAAIPAEYASDIIPNISNLLIKKTSRGKPKSLNHVDRAPFRYGSNWLAVFESPELPPNLLWDSFGPSPHDESIRLATHLLRWMFDESTFRTREVEPIIRQLEHGFDPKIISSHWKKIKLYRHTDSDTPSIIRSQMAFAAEGACALALDAAKAKEEMSVVIEGARQVMSLNHQMQTGKYLAHDISGRLVTEQMKPYFDFRQCILRRHV